MAMWNPWRGCYKCSEGCLHCHIHKGDEKRGVNTAEIAKTIEAINLEKYLDDIELAVVGGESDRNVRPLDYEWVLNI